jgi:hypothetical protein
LWIAGCVQPSAKPTAAVQSMVGIAFAFALRDQAEALSIRTSDKPICWRESRPASFKIEQSAR